MWSRLISARLRDQVDLSKFRQHGTGDAQFQELRVTTDSSERPTEVIRGETLRIEVSVLVKRELPDSNAAMSIRNSAGLELFSHCWGDQFMELPTLPPGLHQITLEVPTRCLRPGPHWLSLNVSRDEADVVADVTGIELPPLVLEPTANYVVEARAGVWFTLIAGGATSAACPTPVTGKMGFCRPAMSAVRLEGYFGYGIHNNASDRSAAPKMSKARSLLKKTIVFLGLEGPARCFRTALSFGGPRGESGASPWWLSETSKCRSRLAPYCTGYGVDLGPGGDPIVPHAIRVDLPKPYSHVGDLPVQLGGKAEELYWFRDSVLDFVYSSHLLEDYVDTDSVLREWLRVLKPQGRLIIFCPDERVYRKHCEETGQPYNTHHIHADFSLEFVRRILDGIGGVQVIHEAPLVDVYSWELVCEKK